MHLFKCPKCKTLVQCQIKNCTGPEMHEGTYSNIYRCAKHEGLFVLEQGEMLYKKGLMEILEEIPPQ